MEREASGFQGKFSVGGGCITKGRTDEFLLNVEIDERNWSGERPFQMVGRQMENSIGRKWNEFSLTAVMVE